MSEIPSIKLTGQAVEVSAPRPDNPEVVDKLIARYINNVLANPDFQTAHRNFITMIRGLKEATPNDKSATIHKLDQVSSLFNKMRNNRDQFEKGFKDSGNDSEFLKTENGKKLNEQFYNLFERLKSVVGNDDIVGEILNHTSRPIHTVPK